MKAFVILCCIAFAKAHWGYSSGSGGFPYGVGPLGSLGAGFGEFNPGGATVVAGPTSIGFGRGRSVSTPRGTISTAVGKGVGTAPHNAGQIVRVGPITSVTSPLGSDHPTPAFFNGQGPFILDRKGYGLGPYWGGSGFGGGYGLRGGYGGYSSGLGGYGPWSGYGFGFGGYGPWGGQGIGASPDVVGSGTSAAISARGNAEANAVGSRVSGLPIGVSSSGTGRPIWTPQGPIGVADSGSSSVTTGFGNFPYGGYSGGYSGGIGFAGGLGLGGGGFFGGGIGGYYPSVKKY
ncbi:hypothetical protein CHS0354_035728 [Potamilus streckersoni]|uniref:Uncharacterized protein n=1 Tax=Potamilus streckersoni TaxID=2493646 RepID=A0AAE0S009_9BIVA|nr:hypothetical protein CHS0354_035728 [Potamilus streckersoni]